MLAIMYVTMALIVLGSAAAAVFARSLIRATIALGTGSAALAMMFFALDAPYAAGFELSVGAGLISVLFIVAISLVELPPRGQRR